MYASRQMTVAQCAEVLAGRKRQRLPWHAPPHFPEGAKLYILSAACFGHQPLMASLARRDEFEAKLIGGLLALPWADLRAWVILQTHYHILAKVDLELYADWTHRLHNGTATVWNRQDTTPGRKVWHRFSDRAIRGERHYWATVNYIHANQAKHGFAARADEWPWSSLAQYLEDFGRERLVAIWREHPVDEYGASWD